MATRAARTKNSIREQKVPGWLLLKIALGVGGMFFILIALIGMTLHTHGQANMTNAIGPALPGAVNTTGPENSDLEKAKGCIGNDQTTGNTFIDVRCLNDWSTLMILCNNWPGGNVIVPVGIKCGEAVLK